VARAIASRPLVALWIAIAVQLGGRLIDLQWHLSHDDFEGAGDQIRAHIVLWVGVVMTLGVSALALRRSAATPGRAGYVTVLLGALLYVPIAVWHFIEHANGNDPSFAHVLLAVGGIAMVSGAVIATLLSRPRRPDPAAA
jgi:hypothetical protein